MGKKKSEVPQKEPKCSYCEEPVPFNDLAMDGATFQSSQHYFHGNRGCGMAYSIEKGVVVTLNAYPKEGLTLPEVVELRKRKR